MEDTRNLIAAMAAKSEDVIRESNAEERNLPKRSRRSHLFWMCDQIQMHAKGARDSASPLVRICSSRDYGQSNARPRANQGYV